MKKEKMGLFSAKDFACYIKEQYRVFCNNQDINITPIKMQKSLYFCFAYWAGFVNMGIADGVLDEKTNNLLFDEEFQAWSYGPVVPDVYFDERKSSIYRKKSDEVDACNRINNIFETNEFLKQTIDSILNDVFQISDFKLVSLAHMDKSWQNHFNADDKKHNTPIPHEEIINEYSTKALI